MIHRAPFSGFMPKPSIYPGTCCTVAKCIDRHSTVPHGARHRIDTRFAAKLARQSGLFLRRRTERDLEQSQERDRVAMNKEVKKPVGRNVRLKLAAFQKLVAGTRTSRVIEELLCRRGRHRGIEPAHLLQRKPARGCFAGRRHSDLAKQTQQATDGRQTMNTGRRPAPGFLENGSIRCSRLGATDSVNTDRDRVVERRTLHARRILRRRIDARPCASSPRGHRPP